MIKFLSLSIFSLIVFLSLPGDSISAAPSYTYAYSSTNFYTSTDLTYEFSGLDSSSSYIWYIYTVDLETGLKDSLLGYRVIGPGDTTGSWELSRFDDLPDDYSGALYVIDGFGNTLGKHYVVPGTILPSEPWANVSTGAWFCSAVTCGETSLNDKQMVTGLVDEDVDCQSPIYKPFNSDGWHHQESEPCGVITRTDDYALLHFIIDPTDYPTGNDESIVFYNVPGTTSEFSIALDDIIDFQVDSTYSGGVRYGNAASFIILNTSGSELPFVDNDRANTVFGTENPMAATFDSGVYNYRRESTATGWVSDGESVWIVSEDSDGLEWGVNAVNDELGEGGSQQVQTSAVTSEVWDDYSSQLLTDSVSEFSNGFDFAFDELKVFEYAVSDTATEDVEVTWTRSADSANWGEATDSEMQFVISDSYTITLVRSFEETANEAISDWGLSTPFGSNALFLVILFGGMASIAFTPLRTMTFAYVMIWTVLGGGYVLGGFATPLAETLFIVTTLMLWVVALGFGMNGQEE